LEVVWKASRTGLINPIAVFEPVELEGTSVARASLHNLSIIENLELGIGDTISVYKANMIIPQILENFTKSNNLEIPKKCPVCDKKLKIVQENKSKVLMCDNKKCKAKLINSLIYFAARDTMNIEGFSDATAALFVEKGFINDYSDIFKLEKYKEELENLEGFGKRSCEKLLNNIEAAKNTTLPNFIHALGIDQVGSNSRLLCEHFNFDAEKIVTATVEELTEIEGYGETIANSIVDYFKNEENLKLFREVLAMLNIEKVEPKNESEQILKDKIFVITGSLNIFKNRKELEGKIIALGGKSSSSVSKNTSYLINNDVDSASSKNKKANDLNVPIISEEDFCEMIK